MLSIFLSRFRAQQALVSAAALTLCLTCFLSCHHFKHLSPSEFLSRHFYVQGFPRLLKLSSCVQKQQFIPVSVLCIIFYFLSAGRYLFPLWPRGKDNISLHLFCMSPGSFLSMTLFNAQNYIIVLAGKQWKADCFLHSVYGFCCQKVT